MSQPETWLCKSQTGVALSTPRKTQPVPGAVGAGAEVGASHPACPGAIPITSPSCPNPGPGPAVTALTPSLGFLLHLLVKRVFEIAPRGRQYLRTRLRLHVEQLRAEVSLHVQAQRPCPSWQGQARIYIPKRGWEQHAVVTGGGGGGRTCFLGSCSARELERKRFCCLPALPLAPGRCRRWQRWHTSQRAARSPCRRSYTWEAREGVSSRAGCFLLLLFLLLLPAGCAPLLPAPLSPRPRASCRFACGFVQLRDGLGFSSTAA